MADSILNAAKCTAQCEVKKLFSRGGKVLLIHNCFDLI